MINVAVIVLHYKGEKDTIDCLKSIYESKISHFTLLPILVANNPSFSFSSLIKKKYPQLIYIENTNNLGFTEGNNRGIKKAYEKQCEYIMLLNNDTVIPRDLIFKLVTFARLDSSIGLISPKIYFAKGCEYHTDRYTSQEKGKVLWYAGGNLDWKNVYATHRGVDEVDYGQYDKIEETDFATGCCMLITKRLIEHVGSFDTKYFLYFEDVDLSIRSKQSGLKVLYYPKTFLWHKNAASSDKPGSFLHRYYQTRNRLYFGYKYAPFMTKKSLFLESVRLCMKNGIVRKAICDFYLGRRGKGNI